MKNKLLAIGMTGVLCLGFPVKAYGTEIEKAENTIALSESAEPFAAGLITYYSLSCSGSLKAIYINSRTSASEKMEDIGKERKKLLWPGTCKWSISYRKNMEYTRRC